MKVKVSKKGTGKGHIGDELIVDFSPKGGPKDLKANVIAGGISFPDGNTWVKTDIEGVTNQKCKNTCQRFGMKALGAHFEEISEPTKCVRECNVVYPQC